MKAYKVFNPDWTCNGFQYEIGKTYKIDGEPIICTRGFHACKNVADCFNYYDFDPNNKIAEVELSGTILGEDADKQCANQIKIVKELTWEQMLVLANSGTGNSGHRNSGDENSGHRNSGHWNSGHWNSGDRNSGDRNSGDRNSGDWNSGDRNSGGRNSGDGNSGDRNSGDGNSGYGNSGDWNSGDWNSGWFNTDEPKARFFNKETDMTLTEFYEKVDYPYGYLPLNRWIEKDVMTDEEKENVDGWETMGGYLKTLDYKDAWKIFWQETSEENKDRFLKLPNFDADIFEEITGIDVTTKACKCCNHSHTDYKFCPNCGIAL